MAIAKFEKVSLEQFRKDLLKLGYDEEPKVQPVMILCVLWMW